jgi:hypothetical protein
MGNSNNPQTSVAPLEINLRQTGVYDPYNAPNIAYDKLMGKQPYSTRENPKNTVRQAEGSARLHLDVIGPDGETAKIECYAVHEGKGIVDHTCGPNCPRCCLEQADGINFDDYAVDQKKPLMVGGCGCGMQGGCGCMEGGAAKYARKPIRGGFIDIDQLSMSSFDPREYGYQSDGQFGGHNDDDDDESSSSSSSSSSSRSENGSESSEEYEDDIDTDTLARVQKKLMDKKFVSSDGNLYGGVVQFDSDSEESEDDQSSESSESDDMQHRIVYNEYDDIISQEDFLTESPTKRRKNSAKSHIFDSEEKQILGRY